MITKKKDIFQKLMKVTQRKMVPTSLSSYKAR